MKQEEFRHIKSRIQRLDTLISRFEDDVTLLHESGVDVTNETEIIERQEQLQDEMEQTISDLLLILDTSGSVDKEDGDIPLPGAGRRPVSEGDLPEPAFDRPDGRGPPSWVGSSNGNEPNSGSN